MATITLTGTSGSLNHMAIVALTLTAAAPAPDFSLTVAPTSLALTAGAAGHAVVVNANALNGFTASVNVTLNGLPTGVTANPSTLTLTPGTAQNVTLTASSTAATGTPTVTFTGTSGDLIHSATLQLNVSVATAVGIDVTTYH
jgi:hypothetical protein